MMECIITMPSPVLSPPVRGLVVLIVLRVLDTITVDIMAIIAGIRFGMEPVCEESAGCARCT